MELIRDDEEITSVGEQIMSKIAGICDFEYSVLIYTGEGRASIFIVPEDNKDCLKSDFLVKLTDIMKYYQEEYDNVNWCICERIRISGLGISTPRMAVEITILTSPF